MRWRGIKLAGITLVFMLVAVGCNSEASNQHIDELIGNLSSQDSQTRVVAAVELGDLKSTRAVEPLITALQDKEGVVRSAAAHALGNIGDKRAVDPLIIAMRSNDDWQNEKQNDFFALGNIGDARAVAPLIDEWQNDYNYNFYSSSDRYNYSYEIADALGHIGSPAVEPLIAILDGKYEAPFTTTNAPPGWQPTNTQELIGERILFAAHALGKIKDNRAANRLNAAFNQGDLWFITGAYEFFIKEGQAGSEDKLIKALMMYGNQEMAKTYLNCGNTQLENAAKLWAGINGFTIYSTAGSTSTTWGGK